MKYTLCVTLFLFLINCHNCLAQNFSQTDIIKVEKLLTEKMAKEKIPGLSIAIVKEGQLVWSNGYGFADLENNVPAKSSTAYRSASIGKTITATAIMQLVEKGKIDLDAPIQKYCPIFPEKKWKITTRQLLSHTSGIRHYGGEYNELELTSKTHYSDISAPMDIFKNDTLLFEPGTKYAYSTYGYNVLGCIVEGASGQGFMEYLGEHIFQSANMLYTQKDDPYKIIANRAAGYQLDEKEMLINSEYVDMSNKIPAGGYITTVDDLAYFAINFMNDSLLKEEYKEMMLTPQKLAGGEVTGYGLGWGLFPGEKWYGQREAFHGGGTPRVSGILYLLPDIKFAVVIIMNLEGTSDRVDLAATIAKEVLELK